MKMGINTFSAHEVINKLEEDHLKKIFKYFGDEKNSNLIAKKIVFERKKKIEKVNHKTTTLKDLTTQRVNKRKENEKTMKERIAVFLDTKKNSGGAQEELLYMVEKIDKINKNELDIVIISTSKEVSQVFKKKNFESYYFSMNT